MPARFFPKLKTWCLIDFSSLKLFIMSKNEKKKNENCRARLMSLFLCYVHCKSVTTRRVDSRVLSMASPVCVHVLTEINWTRSNVNEIEEEEREKLRELKFLINIFCIVTSHHMQRAFVRGIIEKIWLRRFSHSQNFLFLVFFINSRLLFFHCLFYGIFLLLHFCICWVVVCLGKLEI